MTQKKIRGILFQLLFGVDTLIAITAYLTLGIIFKINPTIPGLIFSFVFTYLPDADLIPFFLLRKKFKWDSHWIIAHHPIAIIPAIGITTWLVSNMFHISDIFFLTTLSMFCISAHFVHDSFDPIGLHWFSPFRWTRYSFEHGFPEIAAPQKWERKKKELQKNTNAGLAYQISLRMEKVYATQIIIFVFLTTILVSWFYLFSK
jgi:hypothetical protein